MQTNVIRTNCPSINPDVVKNALAAKMDKSAFDSWVYPLACIINSSDIHFISQNQFSADFIKRTYFHIFQSVAAEFGMTASIAVGRPVAVMPTISVNDNEIQKNFELKSKTVSVKLESVEISFDSFITSEENIFAISACRKIASGCATFSPLFLYGSQGCGKSLLARAIENESNGRVVHMTGAQFVSEFLRSMSEKSVFAFKDFCRNCDTFILDDVHNLIGKRATTDEFMSLLLDLIKMRKNVVLTANAAPSSLSGFDRRIQSVLASGLVADLTMPNKSVCKTMLMRAGVTIDVAESLAGRIDGNGHLISGIAKKIKTYTELMSEKVTPAVADRLLSDCLSKNKTPLSMVKSMCEKLGVSYDDVCGSSRTRAIVRSRQIMMVALKSSTKLSLAEIGRLIGDRDHATVLYGIAQIEKLKCMDLVLCAEIDQMLNECQ